MVAPWSCSDKASHSRITSYNVCYTKLLRNAGYKAGRAEDGGDISIAMDCAASEFFKDGVYDYGKFEPNGVKRTSIEQVAYLSSLVAKFPIDSIEDGMDENDWDGWVALHKALGDKCQLVSYNFV